MATSAKASATKSHVRPRTGVPARTRPVAAAACPPPVAFYQPDNLRTEESVGYLMRRIMGAVSMAIEHELEPTGLTNAQWVPLVKLYMGSASTVAELARECMLDAGGMTRLLDRLEAKALVRRTRSSEDRRVVNLELTEEGRAAAKKIPGVICGVQNAHMRGFTLEEWQQLKGLLQRMLGNALEIQAEREGQKQ
jgi:DNA-binding MarR family transcriptional regulator